jgi:uncharacterized protein (TIGR03435 family)
MAEMVMRAQENSQESMPVGMIPLKGMTVSLQKRSLRSLIAAAYRVRMSQVSGPGWIAELRFDIEAKLPDGSSTKTANEMLQTLLEERFALKVRRETRSVSGFALLVGKDGPRLTPGAAPTGEKPTPEEMRQRMERMREDMQKKSVGSWWRSPNATAGDIAQNVSRSIQAPVVDETGLPERYDVTLEVLRGEEGETLEHRVAQAVAKLGLKLEAKKVQVDTLVVESASKTPTEN